MSTTNKEKEFQCPVGHSSHFYTNGYADIGTDGNPEFQCPVGHSSHFYR